MNTHDAPSFLTPKTLSRIARRLDTDVAAKLEVEVESMVRDRFTPFLQSAGPDISGDLELAVAAYHHRRLRLLALLLEGVEEQDLPNLLLDVDAVCRQLVDESAWKLGGGKDALLAAIDQHTKLLRRLPEIIANAGPDTEVPFEAAMAGSRFDFCITAVLAYLEGDIATADIHRVEFLCRNAERYAKRVSEVLTGVGGTPRPFPSDRAPTLDDLFGVWEDSPEVHEDLDQVYEARGNLAREDT